MSDLLHDLTDPEAERVVLGTALIGIVAYAIDPDAFYDIRHRTIWKVLQEHAPGEPVTERVLRRIAREDQSGGAAYLADLMTHASELRAPMHAARLLELAQKRRLLLAMQSTAKDLTNGRTPEELIAELHDRTIPIAQFIERAELFDPEPLLEDFYSRYENPVDVWGIRTGLGRVDHELGGVHPGQVWRVAGDPGVGKSMFTTQIGFQMAGFSFYGDKAKGRTPGAIYHLEMYREQVYRRVACALSRVPYLKVRSGRNLTGEEVGRYQNTLAALKDAPVYISDSAHWTTTALMADVSRLIETAGIGWVIVDYADLLKDRAERELERQIRISQGLHAIAKLGVAVIVVETLNKEGMKGERTLSALRGTVQKTYDADLVSFLEKDPTADNCVKLRFTKVREGDTYVQMLFQVNFEERRFEPW